MRSHAELALRLVALVVWLVVGGPVWTRPADLRATWLVLYIAFAVELWLATRADLRPRVRVAWLLAQCAGAIALAALGMPHFEGALLALVAAQAAWFLPPRMSVAFGLLQALPLLVIVLPSHGALGAAKATGEYLAFALFATLVGHLRMQEKEARLELARERAVLLGTQSLLEDGARIHERMRVAREVHDAIGHGLTAASVSLQLASRTGDKAALDAAQRAVQTTLAELRAFVGTTREQRTVDLRAALRALAAGMRHPVITVDLPAEIEIRDERRAHALFRLVQEGITNAVKHGKASEVRVTVTLEGGALHARVHDDGVGSSSPELGNGLLGMRERLAEVGGEFDFATKPGGGFELHAWVPS